MKWLSPLPLASHYYQTPPNGTEHMDLIAHVAKMEAVYEPNDMNSPFRVNLAAAASEYPPGQQ